MKRICVIDGQGGGIGSTIIKKIQAVFGENIEVVALGTNAIATAQMLKARANRGASGENAIVQTVKNVDVVVGPIGIIMAHAMMGEVTPKIAEAVASSPAKKILIPLSQENIEIVGITQLPLPKMVQELIENHLNQKDWRTKAMCEANAYLLEGNDHKLIMEAVDTIEPQEDGIKLINIFGEQKFLKARIHSLSLVDNKVYLKPDD